MANDDEFYSAEMLYQTLEIVQTEPRRGYCDVCDGPAFLDGALDNFNNVHVVADGMRVRVHADVPEVSCGSIACYLQPDATGPYPMREVLKK